MSEQKIEPTEEDKKIMQEKKDKEHAELFMSRVRGLSTEFGLDIGAQLQYTPDGIFPIAVLVKVDKADKNQKNESK